MQGDLAATGLVALGAAIIVLAAGVAWRWRLAQFLDGALRHVQGGAPPDFLARDPDLVADEVDAAADGFAGLADAVTDNALLARFAAAERQGVDPEALIEALCARASRADAALRRAVVLCMTRADQTHRMPRGGFEHAFDLAGDDPRLLQLYADRMQDCLVANPYLYLDMPNGRALRDRAAQIADGAARQALQRLAKGHDAALARDLQAQTVSATTPT